MVATHQDLYFLVDQLERFFEMKMLIAWFPPVS